MNARFLNMILMLAVFIGMTGITTLPAKSASVLPRFYVTSFVKPTGRMQMNSMVLAFRQQPSPFANKSQGVKGKPITRAQVAQKIYTAFKKTLDKAAAPLQHGSPYQDVTTTYPNFHAILVLNKLNIATMSADEKFQPQESVSRYELSLAMDRLVTVLKSGNLDPLLNAKLQMPMDMPTTAEAYPSVEKMLKLGVVLVFTDGYFRGKRPTTDAEVADALTAVEDLVKADGASKNNSKKTSRTP